MTGTDVIPPCPQHAAIVERTVTTDSKMLEIVRVGSEFGTELR